MYLIQSLSESSALRLAIWSSIGNRYLSKVYSTVLVYPYSTQSFAISGLPILPIEV